MVKRGLLTALLLAPAGLCHSADKRATDYTPATGLPDNALMMMYDPATGSHSISGQLLKQVLTTAGPQGAIGPQGPQGEIGPQGPTGNDGATGAQGPQGDTGLSEPAPQACIDVFDGAPGAQGPQGTTGAQGPQGIPGNDGAPGAQGPQGQPGPQGVTGAQGPQGVPGTQGSPDTQADILAKLGTATDGATLTLRQGPTEAGTVNKLEVRDSTGLTRLIITADGALRFR